MIKGLNIHILKDQVKLTVDEMETADIEGVERLLTAARFRLAPPEMKPLPLLQKRLAPSVPAETPPVVDPPVVEEEPKPVSPDPEPKLSLPTDAVKGLSRPERIASRFKTPISDLLHKGKTPKTAEPELNDPVPEFYKTGIKVNETTGKKSYRLHYKCPTCNETGRHYVPIDPAPKSVSCHKCGERLLVKEAVKGEPGERDAGGNFLVAYEVARY